MILPYSAKMFFRTIHRIHKGKTSKGLGVTSLRSCTLFFILCLTLFTSSSKGLTQSKAEEGKLEKSSYFAFVDRDFIFTLEMVNAGIPIINFVSMIDADRQLHAKYVRLALESRKAPGQAFYVDTGNPKEPIIVPSLRMRARSSFGMRLRGEFGNVRELLGVIVGIDKEDLNLIPLTSFDFEKLILKVNRLNLGSPDFRDDWRVLKLETMGTRRRVRRR